MLGAILRLRIPYHPLPASRPLPRVAGTADRFQSEVIMESIQGPILYLLIAGGAAAAAFLGLLIWKSVLESHEDDQIFLDAAEAHMAQEQRELVAKINT